MHRRCTINKLLFSILQKDKSSAVLVIFAAIVCILTCLFVTLSSLICSCHREYLSIGSVRVFVRAVNWRMHMQIIAVGVTNRRDQQKARFTAIVVPCGQP